MCCASSVVHTASRRNSICERRNLSEQHRVCKILKKLTTIPIPLHSDVNNATMVSSVTLGWFVPAAQPYNVDAVFTAMTPGGLQVSVEQAAGMNTSAVRLNLPELPANCTSITLGICDGDACQDFPTNFTRPPPCGTCLVYDTAIGTVHML